jgi:hypothetical protein
MKKLSTLIICSLAASKLFAQDCSGFLYLQKGKTIESTAYNAAGQVMRKTIDVVSGVSTSNGITVAFVKAQSFDGSGHARGSRDITYKCSGGAFSVDITANSPQPVSSAKLNSSTYLEYPANMKVGDHFPDATMQLQLAMGSQTMNVTEKITDRLVVDKEAITTPAGTWDAFKLTYTVTTTMASGGMGPQTMEMTQWFVPDFGIVQWKLANMTIKITSIH